MNKKAGESLKMLMDGNARFVAGKSLHPRQDLDRVKMVASGQKPFAIIVSCSDSRVPPEIIFDQGVGDFFVVRTAGNILDGIGIGSIEYAVDHIGVPLLVVMGHKSCGAVKAAAGGGEAPGHVKDIVSAIAPAIDAAKKTCGDGDLVDCAVRENMSIVADGIKAKSQIISRLIGSGKLSVAQAYYDIENGKVEFFDR